jgi:hypothetical protein
MALINLMPGDNVKIVCCKHGCEDAIIRATLGKEFTINPVIIDSMGLGRLTWTHKPEMKGFELHENFGGGGFVHCSNCNETFEQVIAYLEGNGMVLFGYSD